MSDDPSGPKKEVVKARMGNSFKDPDIKNDFCGVHINFQFCKCAFHNQYCNAIDMDKDSANAKVQAEFATFVAGRRDAFVSSCELQGGFVDSENRCNICSAPAVVDGDKCVIEEAQEAEESEETEEAEVTIEKIDCDEIAENWEKYSDIDERIEATDRSFEAKNYAETQEKIITKMVKGFELEYDTELLKQQLQDIEDYRLAIVNNIRANLVKATIRLTYTTYAQIKGGIGAGKSFTTFLTGANKVESLAAGVKAAQAVIPGDSKLAIDTSTVGGKIASTGWNATLEAVEAMGDPEKLVAEKVSIVTQQLMKDTKGAVTPGADITDEEIAILREKQIENELLKDMAEEAQTKIAVNEAEMETIESDIAALQDQASEGKTQERERVMRMLEGECKTE